MIRLRDFGRIVFFTGAGGGGLVPGLYFSCVEIGLKETGLLFVRKGGQHEMGVVNRHLPVGLGFQDLDQGRMVDDQVIRPEGSMTGELSYEFKGGVRLSEGDDEGEPLAGPGADPEYDLDKDTHLTFGGKEIGRVGVVALQVSDFSIRGDDTKLEDLVPHGAVVKRSEPHFPRWRPILPGCLLFQRAWREEKGRDVPVHVRYRETVLGVSLLAPAADAGGRTSTLYAPLKGAVKAWLRLHINQGNAATILLSPLQATAVADTGSKATSATRIWSNLDADAGTAFTARTEAATYTTYAGVKVKIVYFEIDPTKTLDVANDFDCIGVSTGASNAANITSATLLVQPKHGGATTSVGIVD